MTLHRLPLITSSALALVLSSCALFDSAQTEETTATVRLADVNKMTVLIPDIPRPQNTSLTTQFYQPRSHIGLSDYAERMAFKFFQQGIVQAPVAVTAFVMLDESLSNTNRLGVQLAEYLANHMSAAGFNVIEPQAAAQLIQTTEGNFVLQRPGPQAIHLCCAVAGTLVIEPRGIRVVARLVEFKQQRVISSVTQLLPLFLLDELDMEVSKLP